VRSGWVAMSKKSAERRCLSRMGFLVSIDPAATVMTPLASPSAVTAPFPVTWRKAPWSGRSPQVCLVCSQTEQEAFLKAMDLLETELHSQDTQS